MAANDPMQWTFLPTQTKASESVLTFYKAVQELSLYNPVPIPVELETSLPDLLH